MVLGRAAHLMRTNPKLARMPESTRVATQVTLRTPAMNDGPIEMEQVRTGTLVRMFDSTRPLKCSSILKRILKPTLSEMLMTAASSTVVPMRGR
jgi:hypothetical protein